MKSLFLTAVLVSSAATLSTAGAGGIGTTFCYGIGCPCGNDDAAAGCANSTGSGAFLTAQGSTSIADSTLSFHATNVPGNKVGLLVMGTTAVNAPLKDGLRCFGGTIQRFWKHQNSGTAGELNYVDVISEWATVQGVYLQPGDTRYFQVWHRDSGNGSPCNQKANLTSGVELTFTP